MADRCFELTELDELLDLAPGDPRGEHLASCPLCRSRLAALRAFLGKESAAGSRPAEAEAALEKFIVGVVAPTSSTWLVGEPGRVVRVVRTLRQRRFAAPALAAAAVVVLCLVWAPARRGPEGPSGILRLSPAFSTADSTLVATNEIQPDGTLSFRWTACPNADAYQIQLFGADLEEIARFPAGTETTLAIPSAQLPAGPTLLLWRVQALRENGELAHSLPAVLSRRHP